MKKNSRFISLFEKSVITFIIVGVIPLFVIGLYLFHSFSKQMEESIIANYSQMSGHISRNISTVINEIDELSKSIYGYQVAEYDYFYELIEDEEITTAEKELWITNILRNLLYSDQYIDQVYWVGSGGEVYASMRPPEKMVNTQLMEKWHQLNQEYTGKRLTLRPTHVSSYFFSSTRQSITFAREIMDTSTVQGAQNHKLGTLYMDVSIDRIDNIVKEALHDIRGDFFIIDQREDVYVYNPEYFLMGESSKDLNEEINLSSSENTYIAYKDNYYLYTPIENTNWLLVVKIPSTEISASARTLTKSTIWIVIAAAILIAIIYWFYLKATSVPIRNLKDAMLQIQKGDLETFIDIHTNDEVGILADGLNEMTQNLREHIDKVYLAEIRQRDAELSALKTQIQPHYLYNTLEVIRMMAVTNDDYDTAGMLDSLSRQLKYLIGKGGDLVCLRDEIDNIKGYVNLIRLRFDNRYSLDINIPTDLMDLKVPHLILQPIVENAVKHGLRPKGNDGQIQITANDEKGFLEIRVMDNGIGMDKDKVEGIRKQFHMTEELKPRPQENGEALISIGMQNVYERIVLKFGQNYGLEIESQPSLGTIVTYKLPVLDGRE